LEDFRVYGNQLTGPIPELSGLTALRSFWVGNNQLKGPIPQLSGLTDLHAFQADGNQLTGPIPELSGLTALEYFDVPGNQLTGPIPQLSGLTALRYFYVHANKLTGPVPAAPSSLLAGQSNLCGNRLVSSGNPAIDAAWVTAQDHNAVAGGNWLACQKRALPWLTLLLGESPPPPPPACPVIYNGDFESGKTVWTEYSALEYSLILNSGFPSPVTPRSGSWAVWLGGAYMETNYIQQPVPVSSSCPYLVFYHWIASADTCGWDFGTTLINETIVDTVNLCSSTNTGGWVKKSINLSAYAGQTVILQFKAITNSSVISSWYIDDVSFRSTN
jgi:hypothetical protein